MSIGKMGKRGRPEPKYTETQTSQNKHGDNDKKQTSPVPLIDRLSRKAPLLGRSTWTLLLIRQKIQTGRVGEWDM